MKLKILFIVLFSQILFSQITFTEVKKLGDTTRAKTYKYDGNSEFATNLHKLFSDNPEYYMKDEKKQKDLLNYYKQYIGYDIFFLGKPEIFLNKKTKEFANPNNKASILTKLYNPICIKNCFSENNYLIIENIVNDSIKTYTSEYRIMDVTFKAKDFNFDNERITYEENSEIYQDEYTLNIDSNYSERPIFKILNKTTNDTVFVENLDNILFLPHYNFLKEKFDGKKLIYLTQNGKKGDGLDLYFNDLFTNERVKVVNNDILNSKIELLRNNAVYNIREPNNNDSWELKDLYNNRYSFSPFIILTTIDNKKFAISEKNFLKTFFSSEARILEYSDYILEIENLKLAKIEQQKILQEKKDKIEKIRLENIKQLKLKYGDHIGTLISKGDVEIGMTKEMCNESLGKPYEIKTLVRQNLKYEVCYYYGGYKLYFLNNELKQIEY